MLLWFIESLFFPFRLHLVLILLAHYQMSSFHRRRNLLVDNWAKWSLLLCGVNFLNLRSRWLLIDFLSYRVLLRLQNTLLLLSCIRSWDNAWLLADEFASALLLRCQGRRWLLQLASILEWDSIVLLLYRGSLLLGWIQVDILIGDVIMLAKGRVTIAVTNLAQSTSLLSLLLFMVSRSMIMILVWTISFLIVGWQHNFFIFFITVKDVIDLVAMILRMVVLGYSDSWAMLDYLVRSA